MLGAFLALAIEAVVRTVSPRRAYFVEASGELASSGELSGAVDFS